MAASQLGGAGNAAAFSPGSTIAPQAPPSAAGSGARFGQLSASKAVAKNPKADSRVTELAASAAAGGTTAALKKAQALGLGASAGRVRLVIEASDIAQAKRSAVAAGADVEETAGNLVQVLVAPGQLTKLIASPGVRYLRPPMSRVEDAVTNEAVAATNAATWQTAGDAGSGLKIAVIDVGFAGFTTAQASGDLPASFATLDDCSGNFGTASSHGTAVAEIVYHMAPAAQLYLICIDTELDLSAAEAYAKANGIRIINESISWYNTSRGDGSGGPGMPDAVAADAQANGILWVNSAGNDAQDHWSGNYVHTTYDNNLFPSGYPNLGVEVLSGNSQCAYLKWDAWPSTNQDFDLYITDWNGNPIADSSSLQDGSQPPTEGTCFTNSGPSQTFLVWINRFSGTTSPHLDLFLPNATQIEDPVAAGSVTEPASSPAAFGVGAVCWAGNTAEPYSSRGPTIDGRIKPDIAGPDQVSTAAYGPFTGCSGYTGFPGTSASAPNVTGAAALVMAANPTFTAAQTMAHLKAAATDLASSGPDNQTGSGMLHLPLWPSSHGIFDVSGYFTADTTGATYNPLTPTRILDTRYGTGLSGRFMSHVARTLAVAGQGGVPTGATAVTGNLTVTSQTSLGFLYVGPVAANNPTSSTLNFPVGDDRANAVTVALANDGTLSATYAAPTLSASAHVIFDVTGYFTADPSGATYHPLTPARLLDTRQGTGLSGAFASHQARTFQVTGSGGVPLGATAVTGNLTVTSQTSLGFLYLGPNAMDNPTSSTLNFPVADTRANGVTVALAGDGTLSATYAAPTLSAFAQVIFDVTGYFTSDATGATYHALTPARILDTRTNTGLVGLLITRVARSFQVTGAGGVPAGAVAVTGNLTVTSQTSLGFFYVGPNAMNNPTSSTLNFPVGDTRANAVTVALAVDGTLAITFASPFSPASPT